MKPMTYIYGTFTENQLKEAVHAMHNDIHKLLLHKDDSIEERIFINEEAFLVFFKKILFKFAGTKTLFNDNRYMVALMSTLQSAYNEVTSDNYDYFVYRRAILDSHALIKQMFETEV